MRLENESSKENIIYSFFSWLFKDEKFRINDINLSKEIDLTLAPYYEDANIYFPECIQNLLQTKPFKRLERISQLSLLIDVYPNVYHNRLEHSKGVYYRKLEEMIYNFQNDSWKQYIEQYDLKIYIFADLIKMLSHDIGHTMHSHDMETKLFDKHGVHEIIGQRIMLENSEIKSILTSISPKLPEALSLVYNENILNFNQHDESNYDVDRFDYLSRDSLYFGNPEYIPYQKYETIKTKDGHIDVYPNSSLKPIESFLLMREDYYKKAYYSANSQIRGASFGFFIKAFLQTDNNCGIDLYNFITSIKGKDVNDINLDEYLRWDDIRFYNSILDIIQNHKDENIRNLAALTLPNINNFLSLVYSELNINNSKNYSIQDKAFLNKIKRFLTSNDSLSIKIRNPDFIGNSIILSQDKPIDNLCKKLKISVKAYKQENPIYIKSKSGEIYELSKHPERYCDWDKRSYYEEAQYVYIPYLKHIGLTDEEIKERFKDFKTLTEYNKTIEKEKTTFNLQQLQVGHKMEDLFQEL